MLQETALPKRRNSTFKEDMSYRIITEQTEGSAALARQLADSTRTLVLTGAGISTESGIPDFRSPGGLWSRMEPISYDAFVADEDARLEDWNRRFQMHEIFMRADPNPAHKVIAQMARKGPVAHVVTQNIDGLHGRAGTPAEKLTEIHGTCAHAHCLSCGERTNIAYARQYIASNEISPRCPVCGGLVKAAVVSFGETVPMEKLARAQQEAVSCDLLVAVGSSLVVYPVAALPAMAKAAGATIVIVTGTATEQDEIADIVIRSPIAGTFSPLEEIGFD
ncbi:Sir2 family NAD-dependent protein deacetylase [Acuticoccus sp. MNP-M23]|uniref:SIR2 family NAD-dependent protein deacylase n=1 Tax=Acuticoccus sp. MNP-M23 TaxID=3072793 RepID=UPI002814B36F|nr:Sir2 family NAD-dependent protein deacetylase [Acuticoccus sp. MNP-M23]WMS41598.1 Sir2 family NAD-dependent protein deacetylase [Acuticoccus sp. MNP-M23]